MLFKQLREPIKPWKVKLLREKLKCVNWRRSHLPGALGTAISFLPSFLHSTAAASQTPRLLIPSSPDCSCQGSPARHDPLRRDGKEAGGRRWVRPRGQVSNPFQHRAGNHHHHHQATAVRGIPPRTLLLFLSLPPARQASPRPPPPPSHLLPPPRPAAGRESLTRSPRQPRGPGVLPTRRWGPAGRSADAPAASPASSRLPPAAEASAGPAGRGAGWSSARTSHLSPWGRCQARREHATVKGRPPSSGGA